MKKQNPYSGVQFTSAGSPSFQTAGELTLPGTQERFVGQDGHINAGSKAELFQKILELSTYIEGSGKQVVTESEAKQRQELAAAHRDMVLSAFDSKTELSSLGEVLAEEIYITSNREGFMRRFMLRQELGQGQIPQVDIDQKNVVAVVATSPVKIETQLVRDSIMYPPEFYISTRPFIERRDINRSNTDILEKKYLEALEGIMVEEDRVWIRQANATVNVANNMTTVVGTMTPSSLGALSDNVTRWGIPALYWLISSDLRQDIISDSGFQKVIDPVSQFELLKTGKLGTIFGMEVISDSYRHPQHKVLSRGEMYVIGDATNHGQYTDRGGVDSKPIDETHEKIPGAGWVLTEDMSMVIANARSVAKGIRQ